MNAIRPLFTLTLLLLLGVFLWYRISNPGLIPSATDLEPIDATDTVVLEGAPPFSTGAPASTSTTNISEQSPLSAAPPSATANSNPLTPPPMAEPGSPSSMAGPITPLDPARLGEFPPLPTVPTGPPTAGSPFPLPENIPTADYSGLTGTNLAGESGTPAASTATPADINPATATLPPSPGSQITPVEQDLLAGGTGTTTAPPAPRYGAEQEFVPPASQFTTARGDIDRALAVGDLRTAHQLLTSWYGDRSLTPAEQDEVSTLLSQLAGTVVYSNEFALEPHHTVMAGETLETIAARYQVPWQLLAKINGIATPEGVAPGQTLKVLRGPFSAVVDAERSEMALMVGGLYAGRFGVKVEGMANYEGEWTVAQKLPESPGISPKHVLLQGENAPGSFSSIVLGTASVDSPAAQAGAIRVHPADQDDLFDILSVGSKVIIRK